jgi:hypothetical protein
MRALAWPIWSGRGNEVEQMKDEELARSPVAGPMAQIRDEQSGGTPAEGLPVMEKIQDELFAGGLAAGLARTGAPSRSHESFSRCKMTQRPNPCPNPNLARL